MGTLAASALAACRPSPQQIADGDDPLAALAVSAETHRYTESYWTEQYRAGSAGRPSPWRQAIAYCGDSDHPRPGLNADGNKPNCFPVFQVEARTPAADARRRAREQAAGRAMQRLTDSVLRAGQTRRPQF